MIVKADPGRPRWLIGIVVALLLHGALLALAFARFDATRPTIDASPIAIDLAAPPDRGTSPIPAASAPTAVPGTKSAAAPASPATLPPEVSDRPAEAAAPPEADRSAAAAVAPPAPAAPVSLAPTSERPAATSSDAAAATRSDAWYAQVMARIGRGKRYPPAAMAQHQEDVIAVRIMVDRAGRLVSAAITDSRNYALLDREALAVVHRAAPFPPPPAEVTGDPIALSLFVQFARKPAR